MTQNHLHCAVPAGASGGSLSGKMKTLPHLGITPPPGTNSGLTHAAGQRGFTLRAAQLSSLPRGITLRPSGLTMSESFPSSSCRSNSTGVRGCEPPGPTLDVRALGGA
ncbi:hypothetical protein SULPSESMR1_02340 [Pseudosulfitobacter pseudonitzschiae]|uniref:Uncharacterized protein n=1 Tax=Pseudosulfitobacter pseudonitzschiae TaxID=1402135 RepID=A0A221K2S1_9RHOB|nr:hypothetical protein SULPSESMR1_02340 [Pseudosulfitobacter pseudonitzschiae]